MQWFYRLIRRRTRPIPRYKARFFHDRLSVIYYMLGWTAGGYTLLTMMFTPPDSIPSALDVHADPNQEVNSSVYKAAQRIRVLDDDDDHEMKVVTFTNFKFTSIEPIKVVKLQQISEETQERGRKDFFGADENTEEEREEEPSVTS